MVYRGRSGADPEKKGEDVFPYVVFHWSLIIAPMKHIWAGPVSVPILLTGTEHI